jgi:hypothetical protein
MPIIGSSEPCTVFPLGPAHSGKTCVILGMYLAAREQGEEVEYSSEINQLLDGSIYDQRFPRSTDAGIQKMSFTVEQGGLMSGEMKIKAVDYPGEYFQRIVDQLHVKPSDLRQDNDGYGYQDEVDKLAGGWKESDVVLLLFDGPALYKDELPKKEAYLTLISELIEPDQTDPTIIPVVTKVDKLYDKMNEDEAFQDIRESVSDDILKGSEIRIDTDGLSGPAGNYEQHKTIVNALIQRNEPPILSDLEFYPVFVDPMSDLAPPVWGFSEVLEIIHENC